MPLIITQLNKEGRRDALIILGPDNIERIKEKDPFELVWKELAGGADTPGVIGVTYASDPEMAQLTQLVRQGKTHEAIKQATSGLEVPPRYGRSRPRATTTMSDTIDFVLCI